MPAHKGTAVEAAIKAAGAAPRYLPPYGPDFNPIENAFARLKAVLRKAGARTVDDLWTVIGNAISTFRRDERTAYVTAAGYEPD
ncbi:transposase [Endosaccharibacter trunci]|uniref:transposase n=1 Tax=Endosaccharibacter trunci TaxID=2812733 RepID=UPI003BF48915